MELYLLDKWGILWKFNFQFIMSENLPEAFKANFSHTDENKKLLLWNSYSPDGAEIWNITIKLHVYKAREQKDYNFNEFYFSPSFFFKVYFYNPSSHV